MAEKTPNATKGQEAASVSASRKSVIGEKLPLCPERTTDRHYSQLAPCQPRLKKKRKQTTFRVPLKKEDGNMEAQVIEYNCEFPNRVVVRLEYLMQTTKVRLNDRLYMDDLYDRLLEEERRALEKATREREKAEMNRMKKLIIDGLMKDIPPELEYLHRHPVFRVNKMLARLNTFDTVVLTSNDEIEDITPIEPYEFDGNEFFRNLHESGIIWVPSVERLHEQQKLDGKIRRARLRLLRKRKEEAVEEKILRLLNNPDDDVVSVAEGSLLEEEQEYDDLEDEMLNQALKMEKSLTKPLSKKEMYADKLLAKVKADNEKIEERIQRSKRLELEHETVVDVKRQAHEGDYVDNTDHDKIKIISRFAQRTKQRNVDEIFQRPDYSGPKRKVKKAGETLKPAEAVTARKDDTGNDYESQDPLFKKLRKIYDVPGYYPFKNFEEVENEFILDYLDRAEDGPELMEYAGEIKDMYGRQQVVADEHLERVLGLNEEDDDLDRKSGMDMPTAAPSAAPPNQQLSPLNSDKEEVEEPEPEEYDRDYRENE